MKILESERYGQGLVFEKWRGLDSGLSGPAHPLQSRGEFVLAERKTRISPAMEGGADALSPLERREILSTNNLLEFGLAEDLIHGQVLPAHDVHEVLEEFFLLVPSEGAKKRKEELPRSGLELEKNLNQRERHLLSLHKILDLSLSLSQGKERLKVDGRSGKAKEGQIFLKEDFFLHAKPDEPAQDFRLFSQTEAAGGKVLGEGPHEETEVVLIFDDKDRNRGELELPAGQDSFPARDKNIPFATLGDKGGTEKTILLNRVKEFVTGKKE